MISKSTKKYVGIGFPIFGNKELRDLVIRTWGDISKLSRISAWDIDALLWHTGRNYCVFDDQLISVKSRVSRVSCPYRAYGEKVNCPFKEVCRSYSEDLGIRVLSKRQTGSVELVIVLDRLVV